MGSFDRIFLLLSPCRVLLSSAMTSFLLCVARTRTLPCDLPPSMPPRARTCSRFPAPARDSGLSQPVASTSITVRLLERLLLASASVVGIFTPVNLSPALRKSAAPTRSSRAKNLHLGELGSISLRVHPVPLFQSQFSLRSMHAACICTSGSSTLISRCSQSRMLPLGETPDSARTPLATAAQEQPIIPIVRHCPVGLLPYVWLAAARSRAGKNWGTGTNPARHHLIIRAPA